MMTDQTFFRIAGGVLAVSTAAGSAWILSLPDQAACRASGRIVDPTERYCESATGWVQLREHALFHTREVVAGGLLLLAVAYGAHRLVRRRSRRLAL